MAARTRPQPHPFFSCLNQGCGRKEAPSVSPFLMPPTPPPCSTFFFFFFFFVPSPPFHLFLPPPNRACPSPALPLKTTRGPPLHRYKTPGSLQSPFRHGQDAVASSFVIIGLFPPSGLGLQLRIYFLRPWRFSRKAATVLCKARPFPVISSLFFFP